MNRYIISAPRSGLNWVRFCIEYFLGRATPGKQALLPKVLGAEKLFFRTHDAKELSKFGGSSSYRQIDPAQTKGAKVCLILRDPLETFVRNSKGRFSMFQMYIGNIQAFNAADTTDKAVAYYDDLVKDPGKMAEFLLFLEVEPAEGYEPVSVERLEQDWEECGRQSRALYEVNQKSGGGSMTKNSPLDFKFHQKNLSEAHKHQVWRYLRANLNDAEFALLERYRMDTPIKPRTLVEKILGRP